MNKYNLVKIIEKFAPLDTQEEWDCSGWIIDNPNKTDVKNVMLALTPTLDVIKQAVESNCEMIITHHPMFYVDCKMFENFVPNINIYCAHTNFDKAKGGTTDKIIKSLGLSDYEVKIEHDFLRMIKYNTFISEFNKLIKSKFQNVRMVNNSRSKRLERIAFCAGSGTEFIDDCIKLGADALITGDIKYHTAIESRLVLYDLGHYGSEVISLETFISMLEKHVEIFIAGENDPFMFI